MILYALKSALVLMLLYTCFFALTSRETFHRLNRVLLVGSLVLALVLPLIQIKTNRPTPIPLQTLPLPLPEWRGEVTSSINGLSENVVSSPLPHREGQGVGPMGLLVFWLYLAGFSAVVLTTLVQFVALFRYLRGGLRHTDEFGNTVILHRGQVSPFSVFRFIVMSVEDYESSPQSGGLRGARAILRHEQAHIRLGHTYDLLLLQAVKTVQWFSPFVWLLERDLKTVHEYEADEAVINFGIDAKQYQQLLVTKAVGNRLQPFANNLRRGSLKKRIIMMYRKKSSRPTMLKALFVVPVTAITLCAFATPEVQQAVEAIDKADPTAAVVEKIMTPVADAPADKPSARPVQNLVHTNEVEPSDTTFANPLIAQFLADGGFKADDNTLYLINDEVLSYNEFLNIARRITPENTRGLACYNNVTLPQSDFADIEGAENYVNAFRIHTRDHEVIKHGTKDDIFTFPEVEAQYPGGEAALMMQLAKTLRYPEYAQKNNLTGHVVLRFVVEKDGSIGPIKVQQSLEERCDAEAILAVSKLGKFTPAQHQGQPVRSYCTIPVSFRLN